MQYIFGLSCLFIVVVSVNSAPSWSTSTSGGDHQQFVAPQVGEHKHKKATDIFVFDEQCNACRTINMWRRQREDEERSNYRKCHILYLAVNLNIRNVKRGKAATPLAPGELEIQQSQLCDRFYLPMFDGQIKHEDKYFDPRCKSCRQLTYSQEWSIFKEDSNYLADQGMNDAVQFAGIKFNEFSDNLSKSATGAFSSVMNLMKPKPPRKPSTPTATTRDITSDGTNGNQPGTNH